MTVNILQKGDSVLRQIAKEVPRKEIPGQKIQKIIADMKTALASQDDGVAIAAPQIGESLRIFVISGKVFSAAEKIEAPEPDAVYINPKIIKVSKEKKKVSEGCLSVRYFYGNVSRSVRARIKAYNEKGELFERGGSGLLAQIFQHETDHLEGILFTDTAEDIEDVPPEKITDNA